jgi:hypothetical protein
LTASGNCDGLEDFGRTIGTFRGVAAHCASIPDSFYQCTELANRFVRDALEHPTVLTAATPAGFVGICQYASTLPQYSVWGPGFGVAKDEKPQANDLLVYDNHIAVVAKAQKQAGKDALQLFEQNVREAPVAWVGWDSVSHLFDAGGADDYGVSLCWIHAEAAPPFTEPQSPDCGCWNGDVPYCGLSIRDHESYYGCKAKTADGTVRYETLYSCNGGIFTKKEACPTTCTTFNPVWVPQDERLDHCEPGLD